MMPRFGDFFQVEAAEEVEFDDAGLAGIEVGEVFEGLVEDEDVDGAVLGLKDSFAEGDLALEPSAFGRQALDRAWSTRTWCMSLEPVAKKWARLCQGLADCWIRWE